MENRKGKGYGAVSIFTSLVVSITMLAPLTASLCFGACPALPRPLGKTFIVDTVEEIWSAVNSAISGDTILVADGTYNIGCSGALYQDRRR